LITENDRNNLTVKLAAQIIWYFLEGFVYRDNKNPDSMGNSKMYKVEVENVDKPIVFYKNTVTNLWWMEIETVEKVKFCFACSEKEYELASNNEIPELWLKYIQKIDDRLK
jgi:hypothetical protein